MIAKNKIETESVDNIKIMITPHITIKLNVQNQQYYSHGAYIN